MRNDLSMNRIDNSGKGIARLGRDEDSMLAHVAPGEMVVPPVISPQTQKKIQQEMIAVGLDPNEYIVGQGMSINPITGMAEFGFLKKLGKSLKKVVKKVAPIAAFIPGVGTALGGVLGGVAGKVGGALGLKGTLGKKVLGGIAGLNIPGISDIAGGAAGGFDSLKGLGSFLSPGQMTGGVTTTTDDFGMPQYELNGRIVTKSELQQMGYSFDENNNPIAPQGEGLFGLGIGPKLKDTFLGTGEQGGLLSGLGQIGQGQGGMLGGNAGLASLAALYGAAVKKQAEKREGGLRDIRASRRPDLAAQPVFQGFDLGVRPGMAYGGTAMVRPGFAKGGPLNPEAFELDYRQVGGPTIGIGTGTSDDIPAMLSDGEYVFTASANNGAGAFDISKSKDSIMLTPEGKPNREKGAKNLGMLMDMFEDTDKRLS